MKKTFLIIANILVALNLFGQIKPNWMKVSTVTYSYAERKPLGSLYKNGYIYKESVYYKSVQGDSVLLRKASFSCSVDFKPGGIERTKTLDNVSYFIDYAGKIDDGRVIFPKDSIWFDDILKETNNDEFSKAKTKTVKTLEHLGNVKKKMHHYRKEFRLAKRYGRVGGYTFGYLSLNYAPCISYRATNINIAGFSSQNDLDARRLNERAVYGQVISGQAGFTVRAKHTFFAEYNTARFGFNTNRKVDWKTGLLNVPAPAGEYQYRYYRNGLGVGYNYSGYKSRINTVLESGLYYYFTKAFDGSQYDDGMTRIKVDGDVRSAGIQSNFFGLKAGLGFNIRCGYLAEIKFVPTVYYNLTAFNRGELATRFYNVGLCTGFAVRL